MVMSSHMIGAMAMQQQAMFGNFQSYAQQITPPYGQGPGMGALRPPIMGGYQVGPPPMMPPPPPPMPGWNPGYGGGIPQMAMAAPYAAPYSGMRQAMGEQMALSGLGGLSTVGSGVARIGGYGAMAAGGLSMLGVGGVGMLAAGGIPGMLAVGGLEAGAWGAQQLYTGAQQQQDINRVLRRRMGGMMGVGGGRMGMGFSGQEMGEIGSMVRGMANEDMFTSVEELTRLMDRTAGMGLYRGVQSARQFQTRFKELTTTLREVAQTLSTSLEGATQFMDQARQQGFFSGQDITRTLQQTRMAAGASGMSMDQLMAIRGQGTQMGRMLGMRGRQGATAMMNMATNLGVGMQSGAISDELISEATGGLTGAEGAQAAAGMLMQSNARWMRRGAGRVMLAGLWDPTTGGINMERLQQAMSGGMSFQDIRSAGRANIRDSGGRGSEFFANEERIAGQLQETGLAGAVQFGMLEQHIGGRRGLGGDDPLGERFIRRHTGWSQSEFELNREMYRNMPRILEERRMREAQSLEIGARTQAMEGRGIEGARRRLSHWWESEVANPVRQVGADLMNSFSEGVDQLFDTMEGTVKTSISSRTKSLLSEYAESGKRGHELMSYQKFSEMRRGLRATIDEGGAIGGIGRALGMRPETIATRISGINAYNIGLQKGATGAEQVRFLNRFNEQLGMSAADLGFSSEQMAGAGQVAKGIFLSSVGTGEGLRSFRKRRGAFGTMSGSEKQSFLEERIAMYSKDSTLAGMFSKAGSQAERYAILRNIEDEMGFGEGTEVTAPVRELTGGRSYEDLQSDLTAARAEETRLIEEIAGGFVPPGEGTKEVAPEGFLAQFVRGSRRERGMLGESEAGARRWVAGGRLKEYSRGLTQAMAKDETRGLLLQAAGGDKEALSQLDILAGKEGGEILGMISQAIRENDTNLIKNIKRLGNAKMLRELIAVSEREMELGRGLRKSLSNDRAIVEAAGNAGEETMGALKAIARAQSEGNWEDADRLRREFYTEFVGKKGAEELAAALSADPTGAATPLGLGLTRASRMYKDMTRRGGERKALGYMLEEFDLDISAFGGEEFQKLGGGRRGLEVIMRKLRAGELSAEDMTKYFTEDVRKYIFGKGGGVGKFGEEIQPWLRDWASGGKLSEEEMRRLSVGEGAELAEGGGMRGAPESRTTLMTKQVDYLSQMVKLQKLSLEAILRNKPATAQEIADATKSGVGGGDPNGGAAEAGNP